MSAKKMLLLGALAMGAGYAFGRLREDKHFREVVRKVFLSERKETDNSAFPPYMRGTGNQENEPHRCVVDTNDVDPWKS